ncbi:aminoglycoside phosphotransferase family protein [Streptomyces sp. NPDC047525]|uniref:aminoglycoside phosphotransferase family protein n=1 Tax=Streptomyces sp. NPDC047525 TaxID=3155264 RepID=UPI0033C43D6F
MSPESSSMAWHRAVELSGSESALEGPLKGYHHETYVFPLPGGRSDGTEQIRWKCREPRENLLWFDRRCFVSEEALLRELAGRVKGIPDIIESGSIGLQRFIEGRTLGAHYSSGREIPESLFLQVVEFFRQLAGVRPGAVTVARRCVPGDQAREGDTSEFLERLICFTEEQVYQKNLDVFGGLFASLGVDEGNFERLRKHVLGLKVRPFCLLHADLHRENFIIDLKGQLWAIDWELAMFGDPLYDLATHLYLMNYPEHQETLMARHWRESVEAASPGSSRGLEEDLPRLLGFKRAQSVFTDVIRVALTLGAGTKFNWWLLPHACRRIQRVLVAARDPLGLDSVPSYWQIAVALAEWSQTKDSSRV